MNPPSAPSRTSAIKVALAVIPALLIVSICIALYLGVNADQKESRPTEGDVTVPEMEGYLKKLNGMIGERSVETEDGQKALRQVAAMTMGNLGPENLGYQILKVQIDSAKGLLWPIIWINAGDRESKDPIVIAIPQAGSGTAAAFAYGFAEYLTSHETEKGVRLVFYPPLAGEDLRDWIWERCGGENEKMAGFLEITGNGPRAEVSSLSFPEDKREFAEKISQEKGWADNLSPGVSAYPELKIELAEQGRLSREGHAQNLIRLMPLVKDLIQGLAE